MAKNIKSRNFKLAKLFLLGCANAAILTAIPQTTMAVDIEIRDILRKAPEYQDLIPADKLAVFGAIQAQEDFNDLFEELSPQQKILFHQELREVERIQAAAPVLNGARERREVRAGGNVIDNLIGNQVIETGRIEQEMAMEIKLQILEILAKSQRVNALAVKDKTEKAIHFNNIENLDAPLEKLKYATVTPNIDVENKLKAATEYAAVPLTKEAFENTFFGTNITDANVANKDVKIDYYKLGQSSLLKNFKSVATPEVKYKLLNQFENYINHNLVELETNKSNTTTRQAIAKLANPAILVNYLETMAKLKETYIDNGKIKVTDEQGKVTDERGLKEYNKILKNAGLIIKDLNPKKMQALIDNFDALTMSNLALALKKTEDELQTDNGRLVGLNNTFPPFGGETVKDLSNLDAIGEVNPELKLAGYNLKAKEDAAPGRRAPTQDAARAVAAKEELVAPNTLEGKFHDAMYLVKNTKNPSELEVRTLGAEKDLGITIRTLLTLEQGKSPTESLKLFSEANPNKAQLIIKAKDIWERLKNDNLIKQISRQALTLNNKLASGVFFEELFDEEEYNAIDRLNYTFAKLPEDLQNHITIRSNEIKVKDELIGQKRIVSKIDFIAKNEDILGAGSLNNEIKRVANDFAALNYNDKLDFALNKENVNAHIAAHPRKDEINTQINNWINNNIVNLVVENNIEDPAGLTSLQNKTKPGLLSKFYEIAVDIKAELLEKILADNAADLSKASKKITEANITNAVQDSFNAKILALTPDAKNFSKDQILNFLKKISNDKIISVLKEVKKSKNVPGARVDGANIQPPQQHEGGGVIPTPPLPPRLGIPTPPPPPGRNVVAAPNFNGLGMDGLVRKIGVLKLIENRFPKKLVADVVYIAPTSDIGIKYETAIKVIAEKEKVEFKKELAIRSKGKDIIKGLIIEEVFEKYTSKNADVLNGDINQLAQELQEGTNIEFIGPKKEVASAIDQETRNLCVRIKQDIGLMQQLKKNNLKLAEVVESMAINQEEVAKRLPDSAAAQAVRDGEVQYGELPVEENGVAPGAIAEEVIENQEEIVPFVREIPAPMNINIEDVEVAPPPTVEAPPRVDAEIIIIRPPERIVPVEGNIKDLDDDEEFEDDEDFENEAEDNQAQGKEENNENALIVPEIATVTAPILAPTESNDSLKPEEQESLSSKAVANNNEEEAKLTAIEKAKRIEEAKIAEVARVNALEVEAMQAAVKEDETIIATIYNPVRNIGHINSDILFNRMRNITVLPFTAIAAGDEDEKVLDKGIWVSGTYGTNKQGSQKGFIGYRGRASGVTIGFDIGCNSNKDLIGIAYTKLDSKFKSIGNKLNTNIDSYILALYGQKALPKNLMVQAMFAYNHNTIKSRINRLGVIARGKYKNDSYNFESLLSYNYLTGNKVSITPNIGIRYGHIKDGTYQENGAGMQHLSVAAKKQHTITAIVGGSVALAPQNIIGGISITPAITASIENYFNTKSKKLDAKVKWKSREVMKTVELLKQPKVGYNIGTSVLAEKDSVSVGLEYNCHLQKKYQSHQGFVKLKVKL